MEAHGVCKCEGTRQGNGWKQLTTNKEGAFKYLCAYEEAKEPRWTEGSKGEMGTREDVEENMSKAKGIHRWKCHNDT